MRPGQPAPRLPLRALVFGWCAHQTTRAGIAQCRDLPDTSRLTAALDLAVDVEEYAGPPVGVHADLQRGSLPVGAGGLTAVLDWGCSHWTTRTVDCLGRIGAARRNDACRLQEPGPRGRRDVGTRSWLGAVTALLAPPYYVHSNNQIMAWARHAITRTIDDVLG